MISGEDLDIVLVNAPSPHPGSVISHRIQGMPPLGIGYIATWLHHKGYKVKILDLYIDDITIFDLFHVISLYNPKIIGISTTTETYNTGVRIAALCKSHNEKLVVIMGGSHVTFEYEEALKTGVIDIVVRNEGEFVTEELCGYYINGLGKLSDIKGICYLNNGIVVTNPRQDFIKDLDNLPFPDRDLYDIDKYNIKGSISTSRGCPGNCIFCSATALSGGYYRTRSPWNIIEELKYLRGKGICQIQFVDDTMTADIERLYEFLEQMQKIKLDLIWGCESRVDIMTKELLQLMKNSGCFTIQFGVEAGNQKMLDCLKKNITMEQIRNVFRWAREIDIKTSTCLMIGQPYDTIESIKDTISFAQELQSYGAKAVFSVTTPFPGTYLYKNALKMGVHIVDCDFDHYNTFFPVYNTEYLVADDIRSLYYDAIIQLGSSEIDENRKTSNRQWREYIKSKV